MIILGRRIVVKDYTSHFMGTSREVVVLSHGSGRGSSVGQSSGPEIVDCRAGLNLSWLAKDHLAGVDTFARNRRHPRFPGRSEAKRRGAGMA